MVAAASNSGGNGGGFFPFLQVFHCLWTLLSAGDFCVSMNPDLEVVISDERTTPKDKILSKHIRMSHFQVRLNPIVVPESDRFEKVQLTKMEHMLHSCGSSKLFLLFPCPRLNRKWILISTDSNIV